jgi:hypothetical protein
MQIIGVLAGVLVLGALLIDEGEIVDLETRDDGRVFVTQLWIVELDGSRYLRSGAPDTQWLARLRADPRVGIRPAESDHHEFVPYRAVEVTDLALRDRVSRAMADKYGFSDVIWSWLTDRSSAVAIELQPATASDAGSDP